MTRNRLGCVLGVLVLLETPSVAAAAAPVVGPGTCLYLVGAPPGAPAAAEEVRDGAGGFVGGTCTDPLAGSAINRDGENMVQAWTFERTQMSFLGEDCHPFAWVSHEFSVAAGMEGLAPTLVRMTGDLAGSMFGQGYWGTDGHYDFVGARAVLRAEVQELDQTTGLWNDVATAVALDREFPAGFHNLEQPFGERLHLVAVPGTTYRVRLYLEVWLKHAGHGYPEPHAEVDFGASSLTGGHARYDAIEVCLGEPDRDGEVLARLDSLDSRFDSLESRFDSLDSRFDALESALTALLRQQARDRGERLGWELLNKDCRPGVWLPSSQGGRLEEARALVEERLTAAEASGSAGVNGKVARARLDEADALIAGGDYQKACQRLSDALRALTTP